MIKAVIIDDDTTSMQVLVRKLAKYTDIEITGCAKNGTSGLTLVKKIRPDLLFLDVELPDMSGIDFLGQLDLETEIPCHVIIYTAYTGYILPSFRNHAFDFLLKPIDDKEFSTIMRRFYEVDAQERHSSVTAGPTVKKRQDGKLLFYRNTIDFRLVQIKDIGAFQYNHDLRVWEVWVADQEKPIRLRRNVSNEMLLDLDTNFVQINQKYIINISYLLEVTDNVCHLYPPFEKLDFLKVGRMYRRRLIERFHSF